MAEKSSAKRSSKRASGSTGGRGAAGRSGPKRSRSRADAGNRPARSARRKSAERRSAERAEGSSRGRPVWTGTLAFGLVTLPVELYPTRRSGRVSLRMIAPDGTPLSRRYFCERDGKVLRRSEIVRGYPVDDGFVPVEDEELESLDPDLSKVIELDAFVPTSEIDPAYVENTYVLVPGRDASTAYRLLAASMAEEGRSGIATFAMRGRSYPLAIVSRDGTLRGLTLRYSDELRTPAEVGLPELGTADTRAVKALEKAAAGLFEDALDEEDLRDAGSERVVALAERKLRYGEDVHELPASAEDDEVDDDDLEATLVDVMELLRQSLGRSARA